MNAGFGARLAAPPDFAAVLAPPLAAAFFAGAAFFADAVLFFAAAFLAGVDFFAAPADFLAVAIRALLGDEAGCQRLQGAATIKRRNYTRTRGAQ
ncbi:MAG: hypothetical protein AVDCRST_MAG11-3186 [uncultured Gemmatimonadaceae bacterium]|uniref:Uncharacterized protein n=1 Tax=uncultured Gemmatimonadaceae bacterium TaxID=246130 RepID=A0A6J4LY01_9BACT|nr:MAG: hypothetical protein AVDCRST_MAG11-3186 [uncultured Gemmatimonadaceae bacterium]